MIKLEYKEPDNSNVNGLIYVSVTNEINYNFPLNFVIYRKLDNRIIWESKLEAPGY